MEKIFRMRGFFVLLFKSGKVVFSRKTVNHEVVIDMLNLKWKDDNILWLRGYMQPLKDEGYLLIDGWMFRPNSPPWWYWRNRSWYDKLVIDRFEEEFLSVARRVGIHHML